MLIPRYKCAKCTKEIATNARIRHDNSCDGTYKVYKETHNKLTICNFCNREFKTTQGCGAHIVQCSYNPDRMFRKTNSSWNKGKTKLTDNRVLASSINLKTNIKPGHGQCSDPIKEIERRNKISTSLKESGTSGGYRENAGRSKKFKVLDSFGKEVCLQSTFELKCSQILNDLGIQWIRPLALKYDSRNYFADFYLTDYDLYLDPKNSYKAKLDADKIEKVKEQNNVKVIVILEHELTHEFIKHLCS
jgi:hypothetical protein